MGAPAQPPLSACGGLLEAVVELGFDALGVARLGAELQRAAPLGARLGDPPGAPIDIAQMIVDRRILRQQLDRAFEELGRVREIAEAIERPAEAVDDIAVVGAQLDRALIILQRLGQVLALVDPGIAEIVQHHRLVGVERVARA